MAKGYSPPEPPPQIGPEAIPVQGIPRNAGYQLWWNPRSNEVWRHGGKPQGSGGMSSGVSAAGPGGELGDSMAAPMDPTAPQFTDPTTFDQLAPEMQSATSEYYDKYYRSVFEPEPMEFEFPEFPDPKDPTRAGRLADAQRRTLLAERGAKGRSATVATGPGGAAPPSNVARRTLLGPG